MSREGSGGNFYGVQRKKIAAKRPDGAENVMEAAARPKRKRTYLIKKTHYKTVSSTIVG
jgi:1,2-phenylacetyl-CoA epoxidase PaaB subunit